jgi:tripartite ATP-independent transporter DctM subunit
LSYELVALLMFSGMMLMLLTGQRVFAAIGFVASVATLALWGTGGVEIPFNAAITVMNWYALVTLPLFVLMGYVLAGSGLADDLYRMVHVWSGGLRGGLAIGTIVLMVLISAINGLSVAGLAIGATIALPAMLARGYDKRLAVGSLAGAGTLGFLIPPSIPLIVYGVVADVSILDLFIAGVVPGLALAAMFMGWIALRAVLTPGLVPAAEPGSGLAAALKALVNLLPILLLIAFVIGSLYLGFASITEAAAMGVLGALAGGVGQRTLTPRGLWQALLGTVRTCSMIGLILAGALFLSKAMARLGLPADIAASVASWGLSPFGLILVLLLFYLLLGTILDGLSAIVMKLPVTLPLAVAAGFDPVWFGIFLIVTIEMAQITPPVGFNLFVIQGLTGDGSFRIAAWAAPFCAIMMLFTILITLFPEIVLFLPASMRG